MTDSPTDTLRKLRNVLVEQRRNVAGEAVRLLASDPQAALQKISALLDYQMQIEGIDRVILDEEDLASTTSEA